MALLKRKRSGLSDPMTVVTNFVNACNRHDAEGVSACLHPDFDSIQPMYPTRNFRGADQVRRNWQAIFDAEPGFRLTVLRSAAAGETVWLELHGAGRDAEVAGVFVMGIQGDRIRWARIYSALIEGATGTGAETETAAAAAPAGLREVPPLEDDVAPVEAAVAAAEPETVDEDVIAPVVDIDGNGRSFRRRSRRRGVEQPVAGGVVAAQDPVVEEAAAALDEEPDVEPDPEPAPEPLPAVGEVEAGTPSSAGPADSIDPEDLIETETLVEQTLVEPEPEPEPEAEPEPEPSSTPPGADDDLDDAMTVEAIVLPDDDAPGASDVVVEPLVVEPLVVLDAAGPVEEGTGTMEGLVIWPEVPGEPEAEVEPELLVVSIEPDVPAEPGGPKPDAEPEPT